MKFIGIIAEYNPFHNGHDYQIKKCREIFGDCRIIVLMSGNFTQRAQPAVLDKWTRAKAAVLCGADLVIELPFLYAVSGAESFAKGAVRILNGLNSIDYLVFGSEDNLEILKPVSQIITDEPPEFKKRLKENIKSGISFAQAREAAILELCEIDSSILHKSNNILGIEYLKAIKRSGSKIIPYCIERLKSEHNNLELNSAISSAGALRNELSLHGASSDFLANIPELCKEFYEDQNYLTDLDFFFRLILAKLRTMREDQIKSISEVSEGSEYRIKKAAQKSKSYDELVDNIQTRRYTYSRVRRILLNCLFGITKKTASRSHSDNLYARVLAANKNNGVLSEISRKTLIPIIVRSHDFIKSKLLKFDMLASEIYGLLTPVIKDAASDYVQKPFIC